LPEGLEVDGITVLWDRRPVVRDVSFTVAPGELVTLMGPNGSGKTTLLRTLVGLERPSSGHLRLGGRALDGVPTHRRGIGLLFQEPTILPGRSVWENVAFGPEIQGRPRAEVDARVEEMLELTGLSDLADRPGHALSGGERQRTALARTLAARPSLVLLDEPFASIDPELRADLRAEFRRVLRSQGVTVIHVTHDREEGLFLGDRVLLLLEGRLVQIGPPDEVFRRPASAAVARFLGYNVLLDPARSLARPSGVSAGFTALVTIGIGCVADLCLARGESWECRGGADRPRPKPGDAVCVAWTREVAVPG
jgi:thiamine transport system ATP-binding protein